jgi:hypothetical protein
MNLLYHGQYPVDANRRVGLAVMLNGLSLGLIGDPEADIFGSGPNAP